MCPDPPHTPGSPRSHSRTPHTHPTPKQGGSRQAPTGSGNPHKSAGGTDQPESAGSSD
ncbi:hypothetical protein GCM10017673_59100 [Streptosporangium violaceochromogenes]|nr:hypothetical protein GCM10017673_59100 [Streptosporangium violaceochromogenes]